MPLLDALLAFVLVIFAVSVATTAIVQIAIAFPFVRLRQRRLADMIEAFYDGVFCPEMNERYVAFGVRGKGLPPPFDKPSFLRILREGSITGTTAANSQSSQDRVIRDLDVVKAERFEKLLKTSAVGKSILLRDTIYERSPEQTDQFFKHLAEHFESHGAAASARFRRTARGLSLVVGLVVAFVANIDSIALLQNFANDPEARALEDISVENVVKELKAVSTTIEEIRSATLTNKAVTHLADAIKGHEGRVVKPLETKLKELNSSMSKDQAKKPEEELRNIISDTYGTNLKSVLETLEGIVKANYDSAEINATYVKLSKERLDELGDSPTLDDLREEFARIEGQLVWPTSPFLDDSKTKIDAAVADFKRLTGTALPMGLDKFPWGTCESDSRNCPSSTSKFWTSEFWTWFVGVLLTALLAGIGAPFWHDLIAWLADARTLIKSKGLKTA